jgi:hypothetical protein
VAQSPEQQLADFLAPLPQWLQKALWYSTMTDLESYSWADSINPFAADELQELKANPGWHPERYPHTADELRPKFEDILQSCPAKWKLYCDNARAARKADADSHVQMPRGKPGRKRNDELAEKIRTLHDAEKTSREIQKTLAAGGLTISLEAVEAYLKTRRRPRGQ